MQITHGNGKTEHGPGVNIELTGDEVAQAIDVWLLAQDVTVKGPRTVTVNGNLCDAGHVYVDPSGFVIAQGKKLSGRGDDLLGPRAGHLPWRGDADTSDYERGYVDGHHEATEHYLRWDFLTPTGSLAVRARIAQRAAKLIESNIAWLEDKAAQESVIPDIEAMILKSFSDNNQESEDFE